MQLNEKLKTILPKGVATENHIQIIMRSLFNKLKANHFPLF